MLKNNKCSFFACVVLSFMIVFPFSVVGKASHRAETCIKNVFCFVKADTLKNVEVLVIDSIAGEFKSDTLTMYYDFGKYVDQFNHWRDIKPTSIKLDGRIGEMLIKGNEVALRVNVDDEGNMLSILLVFNDTMNKELSEKIFKSIRFL